MPIETHLSRVAAANIILGVFHIVFGLAMTISLGGRTFQFGDAEDQSFTTVMLSLISLLLMFTGVLSLIAGIWLHQRKPPGRIAGLTAAFFLLLVVPLGTLLGSYGIWVLFQDDIEDHLRGRA